MFRARTAALAGLAAAALVVAAACVDPSAEHATDDDGAGAGGDPGEGPAPAEPECASAADCVPASSTCCECPTFAVPGTSGFDEACNEVECEAPGGCPLVEPACISGLCELVCSPVVTERVCDLGFASDSFGCLVDACAEGEPDAGGPACGGDADCVQVPADCCGCAEGGSDTAVPRGTEEDHLAALECPPDPACPGVDVCDPAAEPRCVAGQCQLVAPAEEVVLCGGPDLPACPAGTACILNHPDAVEATRLGLGSCQTP